MPIFIGRGAYLSQSYIIRFPERPGWLQTEISCPRSLQKSELGRLTTGPMKAGGDRLGDCRSQLRPQFFGSLWTGKEVRPKAFARAPCMRPKIMLFDEPTSALDPEMIKEVLDVMIGLAGESMTMICLAHEMNFARTVGDKMIFMDKGEIVEDSNPQEFFSSPKKQRIRLFLDQILLR